MKKRRFQFIRQLYCAHDWDKEASFYQSKKDADKVQWVCLKCNKRVFRKRWDPPK